MQFVAKNGYYSASHIKKIGENYGTKFKSIFGITSGTQEIQYGLTEDGQVIELVRGAPKPQGSGSTTLPSDIATGVTADVAEAQYYISQIMNDSTLTDADKNAMINDISTRVRVKYANNSLALDIVNKGFTSATGTGTQVNYAASDIRQQQYDSDLANELGTVNMSWFGKDDRAKNAKERLLGKYPEKASSINQAFSNYF